MSFSWGLVPSRGEDVIAYSPPQCLWRLMGPAFLHSASALRFLLAAWQPVSPPPAVGNSIYNPGKGFSWPLQVSPVSNLWCLFTQKSQGSLTPSWRERFNLKGPSLGLVTTGLVGCDKHKLWPALFFCLWSSFSLSQAPNPSSAPSHMCVHVTYMYTNIYTHTKSQP